MSLEPTKVGVTPSAKKSAEALADSISTLVTSNLKDLSLFSSNPLNFTTTV